MATVSTGHLYQPFAWFVSAAVRAKLRQTERMWRKITLHKRLIYSMYTVCVRCMNVVVFVWCVVVWRLLTALLDSPQVLIAEEEKIIVEEIKGDETIVEEK